MDGRSFNQAVDDLALAWHAFVLDLAYTLGVVRLLNWLTRVLERAQKRDT